MQPIKLGNLNLTSNVFLAPMAGITDKSFRQLCRENGANLAFSEMVSAKSIQYKNENTQKLLDKYENEQPYAVQLFGREPETLANVAKTLTADIIDINMGCPAPKIVRNGEGCALMNEPVLAGEIISAVVKAVNVPVTVKIRKGFKQNNAVEIARIAAESGASAVTIHGRTREQFYSGIADWDIIAEVKQSVRIPVVANGDIISYATAQEVIDHTNCDAIMIGRAALGNPWIFQEISQNAPPPTWQERLKTALQHCRMVMLHKGEHLGMLEMRKHMSWYIKGLPSAAKVRVHINHVTTYSEMEELINNLLQSANLPNLYDSDDSNYPPQFSFASV
ncbi:MAG: tRNA dihydrouridine synthase DusB [Defluviitaleaceae bacterium]|nr:tRNA dihydrouridine synthase DusB [Defluviitaleaceae bacterium]